MKSHWRKALKWRLLLTTLPIVALVLGVNVALERFYGYYGSVDFSDISAVFTAVAVVVGFMLAGTMSDYKEAEKVPGDIAASLEAIEDSFVMSAHRKGLDLLTMRRSRSAPPTTCRRFARRSRVWRRSSRPASSRPATRSSR